MYDILLWNIFFSVPVVLACSGIVYFVVCCWNTRLLKDLVIATCIAVGILWLCFALEHWHLFIRELS